MRHAQLNPPFLTHRGGCHCGAVALRGGRTGARLTVQHCNCSICSMTGYLHLIVPAARFRLLRGADMLETYTFNTGTARHLFCRRCGIKSFYVPRSNPDGFSVNAALPRPRDVRARGGRAVRRTQLGAVRLPRSRSCPARVTRRRQVRRDPAASPRPPASTDPPGPAEGRARWRTRPARCGACDVPAGGASPATGGVASPCKPTAKCAPKHHGRNGRDVHFPVSGPGCAPPCLAGRVHCEPVPMLARRRPGRHPHSCRDRAKWTGRDRGQALLASRAPRALPSPLPVSARAAAVEQLGTVRRWVNRQMARIATWPFVPSRFVSQYEPRGTAGCDGAHGHALARRLAAALHLRPLLLAGIASATGTAARPYELEASLAAEVDPDETIPRTPCAGAPALAA